MGTQLRPNDPPISNLPEEPESESVIPTQSNNHYDNNVIAPEEGTLSPLLPPQVPPATSPTQKITKMSRALARLESHNMPGEKESLPTATVGMLRPRRN